MEKVFIILLFFTFLSLYLAFRLKTNSFFTLSVWYLAVSNASSQAKHIRLQQTGKIGLNFWL